MSQLPLDRLVAGLEFNTFYKASKDYCDLIENYNEPDFLIEVHKQLFVLYHAGKALPWVELQSNREDGGLPDVEDEKLHSISNRLNGNQYYWHVFNPVEESDTEAVCGDLVDDLGDIYKDLKRGLLVFESDKENAVWNFKFHYEHHWKERCINALYAIHFFLDRKVNP